ncbi:MAG: isoleucine--tRNA ligase [Candidatus Buchananbacteria bacterium]|nr:isoleucine--tRNA ligase [Candidatus Buchananbacteria bacterium]
MSEKIIAKELEILKYWQDNKIFEKSVKKDAPKGEYVFYDGPPFATGTPHYGHIIASIEKDVVPRYWTMKGYRVERRWGWDCHGLPIENLVEKELGFKSKKEIETMGVAEFNETCRLKVLQYVQEWKKTIPRLGRWVDMENPYSTMDLDYMESVWWVFKQLWDRDLIYKDYKSMHVCPRCETTLSQQEVSEGYKDITDISVIAKFELLDLEPVEGSKTYLLAWTTTPWTLPGNVALAMGEKINYVKVEFENNFYILSEANLETIFADQIYKKIEPVKVKDLEGKKYQPLFPYFQNVELENKQNLYTIQVGDFVTDNEGTGIVHIAPAFGEDDMNLGREKSLPFIQHVKLDGHFVDEVKDFAGLNVKPIENPQSTDIEIIKYLAAKNLLFKKEKFTHSYPHCWRCDTPLLNYATSSWFVKVTAIKQKAIEYAKEINWSPAHIKEGRFGKWLEGARDWSISRQRFWASVIPVWKSDDNNYICIGSVEELEKLSGQKVTDLHKHILDEITFEKDGKTYKRIPDVLDTWFDSGSMPYAQMHYPFENKEKFEQNFPAEFIAEAAEQARSWFYYMHILAVGIMDRPAYKNVIGHGIVLAEDGKKMSKRLKNYPDPNVILDKYGADALRIYMLGSPVMEAQNLNFAESGVKEAMQKNVMLLENVLSFYQLYNSDANIRMHANDTNSTNVLDRWVVAKLHQLILEVTESMDSYDLVKSVRPIRDFINELSTWYVRRSRDRFRDNDQPAIDTLGYVLANLAKVIAPFMPFMAEHIYQELNLGESVHLDTWPLADQKLIDKKLLEQMEAARQIVEKGLAARAQVGIKIRQPLRSYTIQLAKDVSPEIKNIILDELNVKELLVGEEKLDTKIDHDLELEGILRESIRQINQLRKEAGLTIQDRIIIYQQDLDEVVEKFGEELKQATLADEIKNEEFGEMKKVGEGSLGIEKFN